MGKILAICTSPLRGTEKTSQETGVLQENFGIVGDAHGGDWHRQVSLMSAEKIAQFQAKGAEIHPGSFGENLVVDGMDCAKLSVGTWLQSGETILEISQIGKECHTKCTIYQSMGDCIMPREGVFAKVVRGGAIAVGDAIEIIPRKEVFPVQVGVITLSDRCFSGNREDKSGKILSKILIEAGFQVVEEILLPDVAEPLENNLIRLADQRQLDLIITTGGTGFAPRDITPEATLAVAHRLAPGISEAIRSFSMNITPSAMLSRGVSVIRGKTLIVNLPGSPKACRECLEVFLPQIPHATTLLRGISQDCGQEGRG